MSLKITQNFRTYCCFLLAFILSAFSYGNLNAQVFFSEYAEGSSNNKYLEIYNAGDETVDLTQYAYANANGGSDGTTNIGIHLILAPLLRLVMYMSLHTHQRIL